MDAIPRLQTAHVAPHAISDDTRRRHVELVRVYARDATWHSVHVYDGCSMSDNIPDSWRTVGPYVTDRPDASVLIISDGAPSAPFYAVGIAKALGVQQVDYVDDDADRSAKAQALGANPIGRRSGRCAGSYSVTICSPLDPDALLYAIRPTEPDGTCVCGITFQRDVALPMMEI